MWRMRIQPIGTPTWCALVWAKAQQFDMFGPVLVNTVPSVGLRHGFQTDLVIVWPRCSKVGWKMRTSRQRCNVEFFCFHLSFPRVSCAPCTMGLREFMSPRTETCGSRVGLHVPYRLRYAVLKRIALWCLCFLGASCGLGLTDWLHFQFVNNDNYTMNIWIYGYVDIYDVWIYTLW